LPVAHTGSNDSFYVSWKIDDSILPTANYASGTMPSGSTSNLLGSFSWYDPDQPDAEFAFKYAVSYSSTLPTDDKFQQAVTGTDSSFSFEQVTTAGSSDDISCILNFWMKKSIISPTRSSGSMPLITR
jgi:hypothetical protein